MSQTILLCDDELCILRAAEYKLAHAGYHIICASDGQEGWEKILAHHPALVITDCQMPRLDGLQLSERIRTTPETSQLPVIMLTAKGFEQSYRDTAAKWGVHTILAKPFSPRELLRLVEQIVGVPQAAEAVS